MDRILDYEAGDRLGHPRPLMELLYLAGPTVVQMASYTLMQFVDTWMLSHVHGGSREPTAAANAGMFAFSFISLGMGVLWVVNTLVSQEYGKGDRPACGRFLWQGLWFSVFYAALVAITLPLARTIFQVQGHTAEMADLEGKYFRIVLGFTLVKMVGTTFGQFLLATNRPNQVLAATICGVSVNALAAWVLIFGRLGAPTLGVEGAAWAQNIGVTVETAALIFFAIRPGVRREYGVLDWRPRLKPMMTLVRIGVPSGVQIVADVLAWSIFSSAVMNQFGEKSMAANAFMMRYMVVSFMPAIGIGTAVTALVGRYIGRDRVDMAERRANLGFLVTATYMLTCGLLFFVGRNRLISVFTSDPEVQRLGAMLLVFAAVYQFFDALYIVYNGALRGAGDTLVPAVATALLNWSITVGGGFLLAKYFRSLGAAGPWSAATFYGMLLGLFIYGRFRAGKWRSIHLVDRAGL